MTQASFFLFNFFFRPVFLTVIFPELRIVSLRRPLAFLTLFLARAVHGRREPHFLGRQGSAMIPVSWGIRLGKVRSVSAVDQRGSATSRVTSRTGPRNGGLAADGGERSRQSSLIESRVFWQRVV